MQQRVCKTRVGLGEQRLSEVWSGLQDSIVDAAIGECEPVFVHVGDISTIYCRTIENGLRKLKTFIFGRLNVSVEVWLTKRVVE